MSENRTIVAIKGTKNSVVLKNIPLKDVKEGQLHFSSKDEAMRVLKSRGIKDVYFLL